MSDAMGDAAGESPFAAAAAPVKPEAKQPKAPDSAVGKFDAWIEATSEWLNPILVKEARQALKSRQFVITFGLLLLCVWGWTAISVTMLQSRGMGVAAGRQVLPGYLFVLIVPLMIIVPFAAFRSLAGEREDGTFELVSITNLAAKQIIRGKLASAMLQVMIFFSVTAPCISFTYMLQGVDLASILVGLGYTLLFSFSLTCACLLLAASVRSIHWQILMTVVVLGGVSVAAMIWMAFIADEVLRRGVSVQDAEFWEFNGFAICLLLAIDALLLGAAIAQLSFASDNRSTKLRLLLLLVQSVYVGWIAYLSLRFDDPELPMAMTFISTGYWAIMGAMMTGEQPVLSPRVRRSLPTSFLGRMAFTWFNPGSASGYVFAVINAFSVYVAAVAMWTFVHQSRSRGQALMEAGGLAVAYLAIYLGVGRLLLQLLRKVADFGVVVALLLQALLAVGGILLPLLTHSILFWNSRLTYSELQIPNWAWTLGESTFRRSSMMGVWLLLTVVALIVFVLNLIVGAREVRQLREETPERVLAEERKLKGIPEVAPAANTPANPFDFDDDE